MPQICVIVPVYKVEPYLHRCIDSILAQTFSDFQLILVDDGSPDRCGTICDEYAAKDSRIIVIHQENGGLSAARNAGLDWMYTNSDSEWLTFIDSDDWVHPEYLQRLYLAVTSSHTQISMCRCIKTHGEVPVSDHQEIQILLPQQAYELDKDCISAFSCARLYHKSCFQTIRYPVGKLFEDIFVTYKILFAQNNVSYLADKLYYYYVNPQGITQSNWIPKRMDELDAYQEQLAYFKQCNNTAMIRLIRICYVKALSAQILKLKESNQPEKVKLHYLRIIRAMLRKELKNNREQISVNQYAWVYELAYPIRMYLFWTAKGILNKFKR